MELFFLGIISYFVGNISGGMIISKLIFKQDIRKYGSGNIGTTNAVRVFGKRIGLITFIIDFIKGLIITYIGSVFFGEIGIFIAGLFVVIGHDWPVIYGFKGGKGIATSFGVLIFASPLYVITMFIVFLIIVGITKYVSLGSVSTASIGFLIGIYLIFSKEMKFTGILYCILALITIYKHKDNIKRLLTGNESKIKLKNKKL